MTHPTTRRWSALALAACAALSSAEPVLAQSFFERLLRPQEPQAQPQQPPRPQPRRQQPAQPQQPAAPAAPPPGAPVAEPPPAPYEKDLLRLAEIMGSLAFLRRLCTAPDAAEWPRRMQTLLEAEGTTPGRRERIAGAYNRGFSAFGLTYNTCTPSAVEATNRYVKEGDQITRNLVTRYGG
ncbi:MAG TPA: TIGR02301 family protein [Microvirga sp.]|jgi:uncharacterized protein (TIGR02301 family)|nr:TIGR02301 family protein [Microvirga sp.]